MKLFLVRHGESGSNLSGALDTGIPGANLSDVGSAQADALVGRFHGIELDALYMSTLVRTHQTIAPLSLARSLTPTVLDGLREVGAGDWEMRTDEEAVIGFMTTVTSWISGDLSQRMLGGETGEEFLARFDDAVKTIAGAGAPTALLVSHGAAMRTWVGARCDLSAWNDVAYSGLPNTGVIELEGDVDAWNVVNWTTQF